uniref:No apical meristem-associated C-terminal domain-containing protein n=1 Tax=Lactuca sativa TaxID=4236 RepID=A0A9R1XV95_LACSA|nr:hypothetical protein LSAT_V11C200093140 [Lactuca sativa]
MDPNQNTPPNYRNRKSDNAFALDTTPCQFPIMESPQGGFINLLQYPTNTTFPTTISTFSVFPTITNFTIPTISTIPTTTTTPTTIITTTTTNFTTTKLTTTSFAGFCCVNATFTTTSTKKEKRKKKTAQPITTQKRAPWTKEEEEEKLAEAWVAASEDPIVGDSQPYESFWEKVRAIFYELMESETRNADQITSK